MRQIVAARMAVVMLAVMPLSGFAESARVLAPLGFVLGGATLA